MSEDKYGPVTYSLAPCRSCESERAILLRRSKAGHSVYIVECLGHSDNPPHNKRIKCGIKSDPHQQWPDAVNEWNLKNS